MTPPRLFRSARLLRIAGSTFVVFVSAWFFPLVALAQNDDDGPPADQSSWTLAYLLVFLAIGLGLMVVCRPGTRTTEMKVAADDDEEE